MKNLKLKFQQHIDNVLYQGIEWKIIHKDEVYHDKVGYSDLSSKHPLLSNSLYRIWSMTKPIISVVILQLIQENKIKLDDPIKKYLPVFENLKVLKENSNSISDTQDIKNHPTIKDLLLHTAGFSYNFLNDPVGEEYHNVGLFNSDHSTLEDEINLLATLPLLYEPNTRWLYSVSIDVLARIIEVVCNTNLQEELKQRIFDPLEMEDTSFAVTKENELRLVTSYHYDAENKKLINPITHPRKISNYGYPINKSSFARGGIGLYSTANDYSKFAQMLLTGKNKNQKIILSKDILKSATTNQISNAYLPYEIKSFDVEKLEENVFEPYGWGYGFRVMMDTNKSNDYGSIGEFGWAGAASTYFLVDPKNDLTAVLMTQVFEGDIILYKEFFQSIYEKLK